MGFVFGFSGIMSIVAIPLIVVVLIVSFINDKAETNRMDRESVQRRLDDPFWQDWNERQLGMK